MLEASAALKEARRAVHASMGTSRVTFCYLSSCAACADASDIPRMRALAIMFALSGGLQCHRLGKSGCFLRRGGQVTYGHLAAYTLLVEVGQSRPSQIFRMPAARLIGGRPATECYL